MKKIHLLWLLTLLLIPTISAEPLTISNDTIFSLPDYDVNFNIEIGGLSNSSHFSIVSVDSNSFYVNDGVNDFTFTIKSKTAGEVNFTIDTWRTNEKYYSMYVVSNTTTNVTLSVATSTSGLLSTFNEADTSLPNPYLETNTSTQSLVFYVSSSGSTDTGGSGGSDDSNNDIPSSGNQNDTVVNETEVPEEDEEPSDPSGSEGTVTYCPSVDGNVSSVNFQHGTTVNLAESEIVEAYFTLFNDDLERFALKGDIRVDVIRTENNPSLSYDNERVSLSFEPTRSLECGDYQFRHEPNEVGYYTYYVFIDNYYSSPYSFTIEAVNSEVEEKFNDWSSFFQYIIKEDWFILIILLILLAFMIIIPLVERWTK